MLKPLFWWITRILSIDISSKDIKSALSESKNIIVLRRHKMFLLKILFRQGLSCLLFFWYILQITSVNQPLIHYILILIWFIIFLLWMYTSIKHFKNHISDNKSIYINEEVEWLLDMTWINIYIAKTIAFTFLLGVDILASVFIQIFTDIYTVKSLWFYLLEGLIFTAIIWLNIKVMKVFLDFEMDMVIFLPGKVKYLDREWLYHIRSKTYLANQIQSIEIVKNWRVDSLFKMWTLRMSTATITTDTTLRTLTFWKISHYNALEDKFNAVIFTELP